MAIARLQPEVTSILSWPQWRQIGRTTLLVLAVLSVAFPYVQIVPSGSYTQPYALLLGLAVLAASRLSALRRVNWTDTAALFSLAAIGCFLFVLTCAPYRNIQEYKYVLNYVSPLVLTLACFSLLDWDRKLVGALLAGSVMVWFWIAMTQTLLAPGFMTEFLGEWGAAAHDIAASGRGALGLAPEPTHHAFHMLLLGGCLALLKQHRWAIMLCALDVLLLARSANGALVLALSIGAILTVYRPRLVIALITILIAAVALGAGHTLLSIADGNRLITLLGYFLINPTSLIMEDYSSNIRIGGAVTGILDSAEFSFMPHGLAYETWISTKPIILEHFPFLMDISNTGVPSGYGVLIFQAGVLVFPFIWISGKRMVMADVPPLSRIFVFCIPLVFVFQYNISAPLFALAYACAICSRKSACTA